MSEGPEGSRGYWCTTPDGVRVRVGHFPSEGSAGTVLLFPGRTEYIEKYGRTATDFAAHGLHTLAIDWRGQGLADRIADHPYMGHVHNFTDYQHDVAAMLSAAEELDLPKPYFLLAHSMGGAIGLRAAMEGLPVRACAFSGPMWGILLPQALRPVAWTLGWGAQTLGCDTVFAPGSKGESYFHTETFETNKLTRDREMYEYMKNHVVQKPEIGLGGPSMRWVYQALSECLTLAKRPSPPMPCLTWLGADESIVDPARIHARMAVWPNGRLEVIKDGLHEMLMENPQLRRRITDETAEFYLSAGAPHQRAAAS